MRLRDRHPSQCTARRGAAAFELLLLTPIFLLLIAGMIGFADLLIAEQRLDEASARAARIAAVGGSEHQIRETIAAILGPERAKNAKITITTLKPGKDDHSDDDGKGHDDDGNGHDADRGHDGRGNVHGPSHHAGSRHLELIEVRIELPVGEATSTWLAPAKRDEILVGRTVIQRQ